MPMDQPTFIVSAPRSGSSWLSRILRCIPELRVYTHNTLTTQFFYVLYPVRMLNPRGDDFIDGTSIVNEIIDLIRKRILRHYFNTKSRSTVVAVSPTLTNFIPIIKKSFPSSKFVHLRRNVLDNIASMNSYMARNANDSVLDRYRAFRHQGFFPRTFVASAHLFHLFRWRKVQHFNGYLGIRPKNFRSACKLPLLEFLCWYYASIESWTQRSLDSVPGECKMDLFYEDLVANYGNEVAKLLKFIDAKLTSEDVPASPGGIRVGTVGKYKDIFSTEETIQIQNCLKRYNLSSLQ